MYKNDENKEVNFTTEEEKSQGRERSKREDCNCPDRYLLNGEYAGKYCRCGALNSMET
jgi:hypothetical protein